MLLYSFIIKAQFSIAIISGIKKEMPNTGYKNCSKQAFFMEMMKAGRFTYW
jgi:hypothetical protein